MSQPEEVEDAAFVVLCPYCDCTLDYELGSPGMWCDTCRYEWDSDGKNGRSRNGAA